MTMVANAQAGFLYDAPTGKLVTKIEPFAPIFDAERILRPFHEVLRRASGCDVKRPTDLVWMLPREVDVAAVIASQEFDVMTAEIAGGGSVTILGFSDADVIRAAELFPGAVRMTPRLAQLQMNRENETDPLRRYGYLTIDDLDPSSKQEPQR